MAAELDGPKLDGPRLAPRSGTAQQLVVFLHGYGADGNDLIDIGRAWQQYLPQAAFVSPHAPEPCGQAPVGRQWFALTFRDPDERWIGVNKAAPLLERFIDAELNRHKLPPAALALVGFSQGTMMALHVGLRRAIAPAAIVGYSGLLVLPNNGNVIMGAEQAVANAAHELRSPLAAIRGSVEVALNARRSHEEYAHLLADVMEECAALEGLVNRLLVLAETDAGLGLNGMTADPVRTGHSMGPDGAGLNPPGKSSVGASGIPAPPTGDIGFKVPSDDVVPAPGVGGPPTTTIWARLGPVPSSAIATATANTRPIESSVRRD